MAKNNIEYVSESDVFEIQKDMRMKVTVPTNEFGDATAADVAVGKTFTSSSGLKLTGTLNSGNVQTSTLVIPAGRMRGDVNYDGVVDDKDADLIKDYTAGRIQLTGDDLAVADVTNNGATDSSDSVIINSPSTKKYKLTKYSNDMFGPWKMCENFDTANDYEWIFFAEVTVPGITPTSTVKVTPKKIAEITRCGMNSYIELKNDTIIFHTLRPPKENIECMVEIFENGDGSAVFTVPPTEREIEDTTAKNLFDGSAGGSLRTRYSKEEFNNGGDGEDDYYYLGKYAFAEGYGTQAKGECSHAAGRNTKAYGNGSYAAGMRTIASGENQYVHGKYNIEDTENKYAHIIGNGTANSNRSNAYTLDWSGNVTCSGKVTAGAAPTENMDLTTKKYVDNAITEAMNALRQQL